MSSFMSKSLSPSMRSSAHSPSQTQFFPLSSPTPQTSSKLPRSSKQSYTLPSSNSFVSLPGRSSSRWVPNSLTSKCYNCQNSFSLLNRIHHCRSCCSCICSTCSIFASLSENETPIRICLECKNLLLISTRRLISRSKLLSLIKKAKFQSHDSLEDEKILLHVRLYATTQQMNACEHQLFTAKPSSPSFTTRHSRTDSTLKEFTEHMNRLATESTSLTDRLNNLRVRSEVVVPIIEFDSAEPIKRLFCILPSPFNTLALSSPINRVEFTMNAETQFILLKSLDEISAVRPFESNNKSGISIRWNSPIDSDSESDKPLQFLIADDERSEHTVPSVQSIINPSKENDAELTSLHQELLLTLHAHLKLFLKAHRLAYSTLQAAHSDLRKSVHWHTHHVSLQRLWRSLSKNQNFADSEFDGGSKNENWTSVGFQRNDPTTDFRGAGVFALKLLISTAETYQQRVFRLIAFQIDREYPFCCCAINLVSLMAELIGLHSETLPTQEVLRKNPLYRMFVRYWAHEMVLSQSISENDSDNPTNNHNGMYADEEAIIDHEVIDGATDSQCDDDGNVDGVASNLFDASFQSRDRSSAINAEDSHPNVDYSPFCDLLINLLELIDLAFVELNAGYLDFPHVLSTAKSLLISALLDDCVNWRTMIDHRLMSSELRSIALETSKQEMQKARNQRGGKGVLSPSKISQSPSSKS